MKDFRDFRNLFLQFTEVGTNFTLVLIDITFAFVFFYSNAVFVQNSCIGVAMSKETSKYFGCRDLAALLFRFKWKLFWDCFFQLLK